MSQRNHNYLWVFGSYRFGNDFELPVPWTRHHKLPLWEGSPVTTLSWWTRPPPLSQWGGTLHRLQALRGHLPCTGEHWLTLSSWHGVTEKNVKSNMRNLLQLSVTVLIAGYYDWSRDTSWWQQEDYTLWHRHDQMYLLRLLSGGLSRWCYCSGNIRTISAIWNSVEVTLLHFLMECVWMDYVKFCIYIYTYAHLNWPCETL